MKKIKALNIKDMRQFLSYLIVGGTATVVEWGLFWLFVYPLKWNQNLGLAVAYIISTFVNMVLGRKMTFKNANVINKSDNNVLNVLKETSLIYVVAAFGCVFNILFLNLFTEAFHLDAMLAKVLTTGIMLFGNYLARKLGIYREAPKKSDITVE
jgi:putative flippase GtrA